MKATRLDELKALAGIACFIASFGWAVYALMGVVA